ncbi:MAG: archaeosortase/exosortase family protein [Nanoarchaeota archaeon]
MKLEKGFKQLILKTCVFLGLFILIQLTTIFLQKFELSVEYYLILDTDIGKAFLFAVVFFIIFSKKKLMEVKGCKFEIKNTIILGIVTIILFSLYFIFKIFLSKNHSIALDYIYLFLPLKYLILIICVISLAITVFGTKFFKDFIKNFKKELFFSFLLFILILFLIIQFQKTWYFFSLIVAKAVYFLLSLKSNAVMYLSDKLPILGINQFFIGINKVCSGIDSIFLFTLLYFFAICFDWKVLDKKKAIIMFLPGIISVFILNILRIYLLILIGAYVSSSFALGFFHTSASSFFFLIYFGLFWLLFYNWMKKPEFKSKEKGFIKRKYNQIMSDSLYRNSVYLMLATLIMSILGFIFWMIGARLFTPEQVGLATTLISVTSLITSFSLLGLNTGLIRYLPTAENKDKKINTSFVLVAIVTIMISSLFLISTKTLSPKLMFVHDNIILAFVFIFFMIFASFSSLIDSVFIAYRNAKFILLKNTIFSSLKILLLFAFVWLGAYGIFTSWMISIIIGFLTVFFILIYKFNYNPKFAFYDSIIKKIGKYSFGNYVAGFIGGLPTMILPLLILNKLGAENSAYYYMSMMIATLLFVIPSATSSSLFAEGSYNEKHLKIQIKKAVKIIALLLIPAILITIFFGKYILLLFGQAYSSEGFRFLQMLALSGIFMGINSIFGTLLRVKKKIKSLIVISIFNAVLILGLSYLFMGRNLGLLGIGYAWMIGQGIVSVVYVAETWMGRKKG